MAVAALVLGIVSLVISLFCAGFQWLAVITGIVGIVLGALGRKDEAKRGMATAGLVLSIISIALGLLTWIACVACIGAVGSGLGAL